MDRAGIGVTRRWLIRVESFRDRGGTMVPRDGAAAMMPPGSVSGVQGGSLTARMGSGRDARSLEAPIDG
jgi:hypothetical protein